MMAKYEIVKKTILQNHMNEISKYLSENSSVLHISSNLSGIFEMKKK